MYGRGTTIPFAFLLCFPSLAWSLQNDPVAIAVHSYFLFN